ncbi:hypothetical protein BDV97DRAFT_368847 [Delphinella strobiligena]|nr:hypothetical protein BDV97DRAFT_368847 [Delphinella strobiligena]
MAARFVAPKMAQMAARPAARQAVKPMVAQRAFSGLRQTPFQAAKRSPIVAMTKTPVARRAYSSEMANALVQVSQNLGMGQAAIGLGGAGIGNDFSSNSIGLVFAALLQGVARNPSLRGQLFSYAILGFAFVEAIGLFDLMVAMMCKYV